MIRMITAAALVVGMSGAAKAWPIFPGRAPDAPVPMDPTPRDYYGNPIGMAVWDMLAQGSAGAMTELAKCPDNLADTEQSCWTGRYVAQQSPMGGLPSASPRRYTLDEIDRMRAAILAINTKGMTDCGRGNGWAPTLTHAQKDYERAGGVIVDSVVPDDQIRAEVEDQLRTYMAAGITPEELSAKLDALKKD